MTQANMLATHAANLFRGMRMNLSIRPPDPAFYLLYKADLTALGLGVHEIQYDGSNEAEREEAGKQIASLRSLMGTAERNSTARPGAPLLSAVIADFMAEVRKTKAAATVEKYQHSLKAFLELSGDMPITAVSQTTIGAFKRQVARLPRHGAKNPALHGKSIPELAAMEHKETIAPRTLNTHLRNVVALMRWARSHHASVQSVTSDRLTVAIKTRADEDRDVFSDADLLNVFGPRFAKLPDYKKWLLLMGLFTGARIEEICQLALATDVYQDEDGIWIFDFNDLDDKNLKTKASKRKVPVHSALLRLGILQYFDGVKARGHNRPFPQWKPYKGKWSKSASKWAGRYFDSCGVTDRRLVYHSLRHGALDCMKRAGIEEGKAAAVAGQTYHGISYSRYGKSYPPKSLQEAVAAINYPVLNSALGLTAEVVPLKAAA